VIDIAPDQGNDARQRAARPASSPVRANQLDECRVIVRRSHQDRLQFADRAGVVARLRQQPPQRDMRIHLTLIDAEAASIRGDRVVRVIESSVQIADPFEHVRVATLALVQCDQNVTRSVFVERGNARLRSEQQKIDVGAARFDERFSVRSRFLGPAKRQKRSGNALSSVAVVLVHLERAAVAFEPLAVQTLRGKSVARQNETENLVAAARDRNESPRRDQRSRPFR